MFRASPKMAALWTIVITNIVLTVVWALARVPIMNSENYSHIERPIDPWWDSIYHSAVTQATLGVVDIRPASRIAQGILALQGLLSYVLNVVLWLALLASVASS